MMSRANLPGMTAVLRQPMTVAAFLAWEERQELRHEFDGVAPVAMSAKSQGDLRGGGTFEHDAIQVNLIRALANRLAGTPCRVHGNSIKVEVAGSVRYPDAFVTCGPIPRGTTVLRDPVVVFEVLSRGTARTDRMIKNREYASTASVQRYVMLEQGAVGATMFERAGAEWIGRILAEGDVIAMPEIGIAAPLAELYDGVDVSAPLSDEDG